VIVQFLVIQIIDYFRSHGNCFGQKRPVVSTSIKN